MVRERECLLMARPVRPPPNRGPMDQRITSFVERNIFVILGGTRWDEEVNQPAIHVTSILRDHTKVLYVSRTNQISLIRRAFTSTSRDKADRVRWSSRLRRISEDFWVLELGGLPAILPLQYPEILRRIQMAVVKRTITRALTSLRWRGPAFVWAVWWFFPELLSAIGSNSVFDLIDDHSAYGHNANHALTNARAARLIIASAGCADVTAAVSEALVDLVVKVAPKVTLAENGVDLRSIERVLGEGGRVSKSADAPIGYAGGDGGRVDWRSVHDLVLALPNQRFVFVGCRQPRPFVWPANIEFRPVVSYSEVIRLIATFKLGLIPFYDTDQTRGASLLKLYDYLACETPVIASNLPSVRVLQRLLPDWILTPDDGDWVATIETQLLPVDRDRAALRDVLESHSTSSRVERILFTLLGEAQAPGSRGLDPWV